LELIVFSNTRFVVDEGLTFQLLRASRESPEGVLGGALLQPLKIFCPMFAA
jgi:hypothetical protein